MIHPERFIRTFLLKRGFDASEVPALSANYHTHTWRCGHAEGEEREYVEKAIEGGMKILGFSDHTPYPFTGGYYSTFRMKENELEGYVKMVEELREAYKDDIEIRLGLEVEYYPDLFEDLTNITDQYPIEYFLLGQHFLGNEVGDVYSSVPTDSVSKLHRYVVQVKEAMNTGRFACIAHPDIFYFTGKDEAYELQMRELCLHAKKLDIPLEINFLGLNEGRCYPNPPFWKIAGEVGNKVIFGSDAHKPDKVVNPFAMYQALKLVEKYDLNRIETLDF